MTWGRLFVVASLLAAATTPLAAQELAHPPAGAPDPYQGWYAPAPGQSGVMMSCCSGRDCAPATPCRVDGRDGWMERGRCWPLPPDRETLPPPEVWELGILHVCRQWHGDTPVVYCWSQAIGT